MGDAVRPGGKLAALPTGNPDQACCAASRCAVALDARASRTLSAPATCLDLRSARSTTTPRRARGLAHLTKLRARRQVAAVMGRVARAQSPWRGHVSLQRTSRSVQPALDGPSRSTARCCREQLQEPARGWRVAGGGARGLPSVQDGAVASWVPRDPPGLRRWL